MMRIDYELSKEPKSMTYSEYCIRKIPIEYLIFGTGEYTKKNRRVVYVEIPIYKTTFRSVQDLLINTNLIPISNVPAYKTKDCWMLRFLCYSRDHDHIPYGTDVPILPLKDIYDK